MCYRYPDYGTNWRKREEIEWKNPATAEESEDRIRRGE